MSPTHRGTSVSPSSALISIAETLFWPSPFSVGLFERWAWVSNHLDVTPNSSPRPNLHRPMIFFHSNLRSFQRKNNHDLHISLFRSLFVVILLNADVAPKLGLEGFKPSVKFLANARRSFNCLSWLAAWQRLRLSVSRPETANLVSSGTPTNPPIGYDLSLPERNGNIHNNTTSVCECSISEY